MSNISLEIYENLILTLQKFYRLSFYAYPFSKFRIRFLFLVTVTLIGDIDPIPGAPIRAEAQNSSIGVCSGGSGGLIRLRAAKVKSLNYTVLSVCKNLIYRSMIEFIFVLFHESHIFFCYSTSFI